MNIIINDKSAPSIAWSKVHWVKQKDDDVTNEKAACISQLILYENFDYTI